MIAQGQADDVIAPLPVPAGNVQQVRLRQNTRVMGPVKDLEKLSEVVTAVLVSSYQQQPDHVIQILPMLNRIKK